MTPTIADNIQQINERITQACARAGRDPAEVTLVAVSKRKPAADILAALDAGVTHFGENRLGESQQKLPEVASRLDGRNPPTWHMVGHVQSRKATDMLELFTTFHSLDSLKLAERYNRIVGEAGTEPPQVMVQVNVSGEASKYGFEGHNWQSDPAVREPLLGAFGKILALEHVNTCGLMTMAPFGAPEPTLRAVFESLAALREEVQRVHGVALPHLSMGMTDDYPLAIEAGATVVRVGRAIFGARD